MVEENKTRANHPDLLLKKIAAEFPDLKSSTYRYIDEGWDHEIIILDEKIVFRFPADKEYTDKLKNEISVLKFLSSKVTARTPDYTFISKNYGFAGYKIIAGKQLAKPLFDCLQPHERTKIAKQLADFLSTIHALDVRQPVIISVSPSYLHNDQALIKSQAEHRLKPLLSAQDYSIVQRILIDIDDLLRQRLPTVFTHNDIYSRHLLWDTVAKKLGVIDFSDMCLGDPAVDFAELHEYGLDFVKEVYDYYNGPKRLIYGASLEVPTMGRGLHDDRLL